MTNNEPEANGLRVPVKIKRPLLRDGAWYCQNENGIWHVWNEDLKPKPGWVEMLVQVPPPGSGLWGRARSASSALLIYLTGLGAVLAVLFVTVFFVSKNPQVIGAVLAPVTGVIGAFTGHAAGNAAAKGY